ncbi:MAG: tetratricopeptide repeat protein, partial [Thermodesulfovibrionales bacterium]|nr:tetratricopeptide repeat protein [Thermodesulfovibrionales bacterium]
MDRRDFLKTSGKGLLATIAIGIGLKAENSHGEESMPRNHENLYENIAKRMEQMNSEKRYDEVIALGEQYANQQDNRSGYFYNELASAKANLNELGEAKKLFEKSLQVRPNHPQTTFNLGVTYAKLGNKKEAILYLEKSLKLDPHHESSKNAKDWIKYLQK